MRITKTNVKKLHDALSKMNETITIGERTAVNRFKLALQTYCEDLKDITRVKSMWGTPLDKIAQELDELVNVFPILFDKYSGD